MSKAKERKIFNKALTSEEFAQLARAAKDVFYFATFIYLIHPVRGKVKFDLYPFQKSVLWHFLTRRFNIILKFRQAGVTELISMYCLWLCMFHPNKNVVIVSIKERVAKKVLRKIKYMYRNLPEHLKVPVINGKGDEIGTVTELEFSNGSLITSIPTTEEAGRSEAVSLLVIDEAAIVRWANQIWAAAFPTLSTGGAAIVNSTPYGVGNWFHQMWVTALSSRGESSFNPIRLRWQMHPERDEAWYKEMADILGPKRTAQEIDGDFLTSGNSVFNLADIREIEEDIADYQYHSIEMDKSLYIIRPPEKNQQYFIGADVASGRARDYSAFTILDRFGNEMACYKGKMSVGRYAELLIKMGKKYNNAIIAPESNDIGMAVTTKIQDSGYSKLYYSKKFLRIKGERRHQEEKIPGWITTSKNRHVIIAHLEEDVRLGNIKTLDPHFVSEAYTFIYDEQNRPIALGKGKVNEDDELSNQTFSDDAIMAKSISNFVRKGKLVGPIMLPR